MLVRLSLTSRPFLPCPEMFISFSLALSRLFVCLILISPSLGPPVVCWGLAIASRVLACFMLVTQHRHQSVTSASPKPSMHHVAAQRPSRCCCCCMPPRPLFSSMLQHVSCWCSSVPVRFDLLATILFLPGLSGGMDGWMDPLAPAAGLEHGRVAVDPVPPGAAGREGGAWSE